MLLVKSLKVLICVFIILSVVSTNKICLSQSIPTLRKPIEFVKGENSRHVPDLTRNGYLRGIYEKLPSHKILAKISAPKDAPFDIYDRDIRTYSLDVIKMGYSLWIGESDKKAYATATYYTTPRENLTDDQMINYVEAILNFAGDITQAGVNLLWCEFFGLSIFSPSNATEGVFVIIEDTQKKQFTELLKKLAQEYTKGLLPPKGEGHIYRKVDINSELGRKIFILTNYLSSNYGMVCRIGENHDLSQNIFVDEKGHLYIGGLSKNLQSYKLACAIGKDIFNIAETILAMPDEIEGSYIARHVFQRLISGYSKDELILQDTRKARTARLIWLVWAGIVDPWFYNTVNVEDIPVDFDFDGITGPYKRFKDIDIDKFTWQIARFYFQVQTEAMDAYYNIEDYDLRVIPEIIAKLQEKKSYIKTWLDENVPYVLIKPEGDIRFRDDIYNFLTNKLENNGEWIWQVVTKLLNKLTGSELTVTQVKEMANSNRGIGNSVSKPKDTGLLRTPLDNIKRCAEAVSQIKGEETTVPDTYTEKKDRLYKIKENIGRYYKTLNELSMEPSKRKTEKTIFFPSNEPNDLEVMYKKDHENSIVGAKQVYMGSSIEQNFTYVINQDADLGLIVDSNAAVTEIVSPALSILIQLADNRNEFLSFLFSRPIDEQEKHKELIDWETTRNIFKDKEFDKKIFDDTLALLKDLILPKLDKAIQEEAEGILYKFFSRYKEIDQGDSVKFSYLWMANQEGYGSWLYTDANFQLLKNKLEQGKIIGVTTNFIGDEFSKIAGYLKACGKKIKILYISNIEKWLFARFLITGSVEEFIKLFSNIENLPIDNQAIVITSAYGGLTRIALLLEEYIHINKAVYKEGIDENKIIFGLKVKSAIIGLQSARDTGDIIEKLTQIKQEFFAKDEGSQFKIMKGIIESLEKMEDIYVELSKCYPYEFRDMIKKISEDNIELTISDYELDLMVLLFQYTGIIKNPEGQTIREPAYSI